MGKDSGVDTSGMERSAAMMGSMGDRMMPYEGKYWQLAQDQLDFGREQYAYGKARTEKYADPVLNEFARIMGFGGKGAGGAPAPVGGAANNLGIGASQPAGGYVSPTESALYQAPAWQTAQSTDQAKAGILRNTKPGPQQTALLADADNKRSANLGVNAFSQVQSMLTSLLGQGGEVWKGVTANQQGMTGSAGALSGGIGALGAAGGMYSGQGQMNANIAQLQQQAKESNNSMLGSVFSAIGTIGGMVLGGPIGGAIGGMMGGAAGGAAGGGGSLIGTSNAYSAGSLGF
jgi:hypothetical protein